ncbi:MAG: DUF86 domain-containing protein [Bryobacterales bacterium]|nr:DUF86 domain-containing protein [Bryobacterales bacterium]
MGLKESLAWCNVLVHAYFDVDFETIWTIVSHDLGALEVAAAQLKA